MRAVSLALYAALAIGAGTGAGCGSGGDSPVLPDGAEAPDAAPPDAASFAACREFAVAATTVPASVASSLAGADLVAPEGCADVDAPFGVETPGADAVTRIDGLVVGDDYVVRVDGNADLSFYVATGCSTEAGPSASECLMFRDASLASDETGRFTATTTSAYVVVDYYESTAPDDRDFTVQAYHVDCESDAQCHGATPACAGNRCVECLTDFQCPNAARPVCSATAQGCVAGSHLCSREDDHDATDDGPAGATALVPDDGGNASLTGLICAAPASERDYARFTVATAGQTWELRLDWSDGQDLDLAVFDAHGTELGISFWEKPERIRLTDLAAGTYVVQTTVFSPTIDTAAAAYTLTASRESTIGCVTDAQCDDEFRNQLYRGRCDQGACVAIAGNGLLGDGAACDSIDDCGPGLACPAFPFVADAATRTACAPTCAQDTDCGGGFVCTTYLLVNQCVPLCTDDDQCPVIVGEQPAVPPWSRLGCERSSGRCLP